MEIKGQLEDIIYQNDINGYTIATLYEQEEGKVITVVGYLPFISVGDTLKIQGNYVIHQDYGEQFKINTFEKIMPETLGELERYLGSGAIKGIGPATAKKIIDTFGDETISILKLDSKKLATIKGISKEKAIEMSEEFNEKWELWQIVGFLQRFGISASNSKKVYDKLGKDAISEIENNPYILIDITYGVDFKKVDKIAMDLGISYNHEKRIESAIKFALISITYNGNTCVIKENLVEYIETLIGVSREDIENSLINLNARKDVSIEKREEVNWVYLYPFYKAELNIAKKIISLNNSKNSKFIDNIYEIIKKQEKEFKIKLSDKQKEAMNAVNDNNVTVITGGPGTRKDYNY